MKVISAVYWYNVQPKLKLKFYGKGKEVLNDVKID